MIDSKHSVRSDSDLVKAGREEAAILQDDSGVSSVPDLAVWLPRTSHYNHTRLTSAECTGK